MKLLSKTVSRSAILCSTLLLLSMFFQSCSTVNLQGSVDGYRETYSNGPYTYSSPTGEQFGANVGLIFMGVPNTGSNGMSLYNRDQDKPVYAASNLDPASLAFIDQPQPGNKPYNFTDHLSYMGGLEFIMKRAGDGGNVSNLDYLQIPVYGLYKTAFLSGTAFGGLGPYFAYGIAGSSGSLPSFGGASGFNRFDAGIDFTLGYKLQNSLYVNLVYSRGLANIEPAAGGYNVRNSGFSLNVGYPISKLIKSISK